ncbi:MAG TPA: thermonuclease family protein [Nevskiaceae bacterium]|nr:thermonuclease family protein [Nevskiaceae bacterium]
MSRGRKKQAPLIVVFIILVVAVGQHYGWLQNTQQTVTQKASETQPGLYAVDHFVDGDTIAVDMNGKTETIRMIGIDTPETHKPNSPVQCYGPAAAAYTKNLIGDNRVRLEADPKSQNRDRYKRLLRYVYLPDGKLVEYELIANGYGFAYTQFPFTKSDQFVEAEEAAETVVKGLWGNCTVTVEANGRKQTNNLSP